LPKPVPLPYEDPALGKQQVEQLFNRIAKRYDLLNHLLSLGIDKLWRRRAIKLLKVDSPQRILDVATGTADFAIEALKLNPQKVIGIDLSERMLEIGRKKIKQRGLAHIELLKADCEELPFNDNIFDAITVGFGVRNFEDPDKGLKQMYRVLKKGGKLIVLEFSKPRIFPFKQLFNFYFLNVLPFIGGLISGDKHAYSYLPRSVKTFPEREDFLAKLTKAGFQNNSYIALTLGVCAIYIGKKS